MVKNPGGLSVADECIHGVATISEDGLAPGFEPGNVRWAMEDFGAAEINVGRAIGDKSIVNGLGSADHAAFAPGRGNARTDRAEGGIIVVQGIHGPGGAQLLGVAHAADSIGFKLGPA